MKTLSDTVAPREQYQPWTRFQSQAISQVGRKTAQPAGAACQIRPITDVTAAFHFEPNKTVGETTIASRFSCPADPASGGTNWMEKPAVRKFGRYEIVAELGRGAMGIVYKARDPQIGRLVALKTVSLSGQEPEEEEEFRQRFLREAQAAGRLQHPGLVAIYDAGEEADSHDPYIVLEFVSGESLNRILSREKKLPLARALQLAVEIAEALDYAHAQGVVHRDIKPANILITEDGHAKIADFGIAQLNLAHFTVPGRVLGTPAFMAPEQLSGEGVDRRSDIFSLGVVLYAMVTGHSAFHGNSATTVCFKVVNRDPVPASALDLDLPRALDAIIARAMAKNPDERYQSGADFADALRALPESGSVSGLMAATTKSGTIRPNGQHDLLHAERFFRSAIRRVPLKYLVIGAAALVLLILIAIPTRQAMISQNAAAVRIDAPQGSSVPIREPDSGKPRDSIVAAMDVPGGGIEPVPSRGGVKAKVASKAKAHHASVPAPAAAAASAPSTEPAETTATPAPTSTLELAVEHQFKEATLTVWVDNKLVLTRQLIGGSRKKLVVFKGMHGVESESLQLRSGTHQLRVRAQSSDQAIDLSRTISADFAPGGDKTLQISFDKHNSSIHLTWQ